MSDKFENEHVLQCLLCRRVRWIRRERDSIAEWEGMTDFLTHYRLTLISLVVADAYCETCGTFYRQLLTYGQPGQTVAGLPLNDQITA